MNTAAAKAMVTERSLAHAEPGAWEAVVTSAGFKLLSDVFPGALMVEGSLPSSYRKWFSVAWHSPDNFSCERGVQTKAVSQALLNIWGCDQVSQLTARS